VEWPTVLPFAVVSWATVLGLAGLCAARFPKLPYQFIVSTFFISGFVLIIAHNLIGHVLLIAIDRIAQEILVLLPTGWPALLFQLMLPDGSWSCLWLLAPVVLIIWTAKSSHKLLRGRYNFTEPVTPEPPDIVPSQLAETDLTHGEPPRLGITAIEEIVESGNAFALIDWNQIGWIEGRLWHWLDARERRLAEFAFPTGFPISRPWIKIVRNFVMAVAAAFVIGSAGPLLKTWVLGLGFFITFCQVLAQMFATGKVFRPIWSSSVLIPIYANFNVGFRELARFFLKCSIVQLPFTWVYAVACSVLVSYLYDFPILSSLQFGFKCGCLVFAGRFIMLVFCFSSGTNDTTRFRGSTVALFGIVVVVGLLFMLLGGASLFVPDMSAAWMLLAAALFDAYLFLWIYEWFYNRGKFDLMKVPQR
jgi:hypothetical protein